MAKRPPAHPEPRQIPRFGPEFPLMYFMLVYVYRESYYCYTQKRKRRRNGDSRSHLPLRVLSAEVAALNVRVVSPRPK